MLETKLVNLYEHYGIERQGAQGGVLQVWGHHTPVEISPVRRKRPAVLILPGGAYQLL